MSPSSGPKPTATKLAAKPAHHGAGLRRSGSGTHLSRSRRPHTGGTGGLFQVLTPAAGTESLKSVLIILAGDLRLCAKTTDFS